ncbi:MAG: phosphinothricin acetyltransferase [Frankiaceae bacterium]|nr:phosphinothricin acetyltransferase [Frankiaceae bacterium]MDQ1727476.1 phosphinothricin acetyltransferase [Frankiaceae bacterium]
MPDIRVRPITVDDLAAVNDIYNFWIRTSAANFYVDDITSAERRAWFAELGGRYRAVVAVEGNDIVGFAYSGKVRPRAAYDTSVETTVYVADGHGRRGIGTLLYDGLFEALRDEDIHRLYAVIALPNESSVALHERFGFRRAGLFSEQGRKFGRYWDVGWYERAWPP